MRFVVISSSPLVSIDGAYYAYGPYVKELHIWAAYAGEVSFMCPVWESDNGLLISKIDFPVSHVFHAKEFHIKSIKGLAMAFRHAFGNFRSIYMAMKWAEHIHLRCPGNIGLMGCLVQVLFPTKPKTAKYAGNWDPDSVQPLSYRLQKWILQNTLLTRNMQVLVYGQWASSTRNIKPFFTASYTEADKGEVVIRNLQQEIDIVFVGTLVAGKRALYAIQLLKMLRGRGLMVRLSLYGNGKEMEGLLNYVADNQLETFVRFMGNQPAEIIKKAFQQSHFVILPSKSEGWPKVIAEGMFWGCVPLATKVSCLPYMLDDQKRGLFLDLDLEKDAAKIHALLIDEPKYVAMANESISWARQFTLDLFAAEIKALLIK